MNPASTSYSPPNTGNASGWSSGEIDPSTLPFVDGLGFSRCVRVYREDHSFGVDVEGRTAACRLLAAPWQCWQPVSTGGRPGSAAVKRWPLCATPPTQLCTNLETVSLPACRARRRVDRCASLRLNSQCPLLVRGPVRHTRYARARVRDTHGPAPRPASNAPPDAGASCARARRRPRARPAQAWTYGCPARNKDELSTHAYICTIKRRDVLKAKRQRTHKSARGSSTALTSFP